MRRRAYARAPCLGLQGGRASIRAGGSQARSSTARFRRGGVPRTSCDGPPCANPVPTDHLSGQDRLNRILNDAFQREGEPALSPAGLLRPRGEGSVSLPTVRSASSELGRPAPAPEPRAAAVDCIAAAQVDEVARVRVLQSLPALPRHGLYHAPRSGITRSGIGRAENSRRHGKAMIRAQRLARLTRALSVAIPVLAYIWR